jgi:hypothetical protein
MPIASLITIKAKIKLIAKAGESNPSFMAQAEARAQTVAECDEGIPPVPKNSSSTEKVLILNIPVKTFNIWATNHADAAHIMI